MSSESRKSINIDTTDALEELHGAFDISLSPPPFTLSGDFYYEPDNARRGISLPPGETLSFVQPFESFGSFGHSKCGRFGEPLLSCQEFAVTDVPPVLTEDLRRNLEITTLRLSGKLPSDIGNSLLTFLHQEVVDAEITKVKREKYVIRAKVFISGLPFDVKIRIYQDREVLAVEFQRRSGDSVAFMKFFERASGYVLEPLSYNAVLDGENLPEVPQSVALSATDAIAPLLNMADATSDTGLLSEVASTLRTMAEDPAVARELYTPCASSVLQRLQQMDDFCVSLPTSQLVACM